MAILLASFAKRIATFAFIAFRWISSYRKVRQVSAECAKGNYENISLTL